MTDIAELERTIAEKEREEELLAARRRELEGRLARLTSASAKQYAAV
jgi:hypothetical protein